MKSNIFVLALGFLIAGPLFAETTPPTGTTKMKLEDTVTLDHETLVKEITELNGQIQSLDKKIAGARAKSQSYSRMGAEKSSLIAAAEAEALSLEMERKNLQTQRSQMQEQLSQ